jgi:hypothetical protein
VSALRSIHFPPPDLTPAPAETPPPAAKEYLRPDIVLLGSIRGASDQIREELRLIGDEQNYHTALLVLKTQGRLIGDLAEELLRRFDEAALLIQQRAQKP